MAVARASNSETAEKMRLYFKRCERLVVEHRVINDLEEAIANNIRRHGELVELTERKRAAHAENLAIIEMLDGILAVA